MSFDVKWILFDFGGCLDSDGIHSRKLFYKQFEEHNLIKHTYEHFQHAYSYSDKKVITESLIVNSTLLDMNKQMCFYIAQFLQLNDPLKIQKVAESITQIQSFYLERNKTILASLKTEFNLGIISNFSGNLNVILNQFQLSSFFVFVLDSYHVGVSKPDLKIFELAMSKCGVLPSEVCFIGDNEERDIGPASQIGMKTILLNEVHTASVADATITSLLDLPKLIHRR